MGVTHWMARMTVMRFWKVELSPTYRRDLSMVRKVFSISLTVNSGFLKGMLLVNCDWSISSSFSLLSST